ncbi:MAG: thioesterase family protein [Moheibacter sp.]
MLSSTISLRVRYGETDQMGVVYHGNYATYCEVARVEFFREIGLPYKELESRGVMLPVVELNLKFLRPAYYDELLLIETSIPEIPKSARIRFDYTIRNENGDILTTGHCLLAFVDMETRRPVRCPEYMVKRMNELVGK